MKLKLLLLFLFVKLTHPAISQESGNIQLNQCGFYQYGPKTAIITNAGDFNNFYILTANKKDTVYTGLLGGSVKSDYSSVNTRAANFSGFTQPGTYIVAVQNAGYSSPFYIGNNIHHALSIISLKGFYYQRVSMPLEKKHAEQWSRSAGHPDTTVLVHPSAATAKRPASYIVSSPGGWYDAGDYNKYIVNCGITMGTLLSAYEDFSAYFDTLKTNIPESSNTIPDLLDEILYNLRWMLTMQDPDDGGVYNKCTNAAFDGVVMPGVTKLPRYVVQKGTAATLDFAAVMAQAARIFTVFKKELPGLSDTCLAAAKYAWLWAHQHPDVIYDQASMNTLYKPAITTGPYGDRNFSDEKFWAASELYSTTKDKKYIPAIQQYTPQQPALPSWSNVGMLGCYTLLRNEKKIKNKKISFVSLRKTILGFADGLIANGGNKAFETIMGQSKKDFIWGSNSVALNQSIVLLNAYQITGNKQYISFALTNLDYIMGRNATGFCFVTGISNKSPLHIHHRPSQSDGIVPPVPGLLVAGPNPGMQDKCHYTFTEPETAYMDDNCAYASNEVAINWNAPLVYVSAAIEALQYKASLSGRQ